MVNYLSDQEILVIHARIVDETGGMHGVRDLNLAASIAERPKMSFSGKDLYPTVFGKAAVYFESCAFNHVFVDGNKRTAIALAARFLYLNGHNLITTNQILEKFVLKAVKEKYNLDKIAVWLEKHSKNK